MNKLLIIGFQPFNKGMYPHTYDLINALENVFKLDYIYFDRGYKIATIIEPRINRIFSLLTHFNQKHLYERIENEQDYILNLDQYKVIIAIDHWAFRIAAKNINPNSKLIFWSLDFISPESKWAKTIFYKNLINKNKEDICKADSIIIQDVNRARVFDEILFSNNIKKIYLPVSLFDDKYARDVSKNKNSLESIKKPSVMQIHATKARGSNLLLKEFESINNSDLMFQGIIEESINKDIGKCKVKPRVMPYVDNVSEMRKNISIADIGFLNYEEEDSNHKYISYACGQLVEYLRLGIPVIIWKPKDLGKFVSKNNIGVYLPNLKDLPKAISQISKNYKIFSINARLIFKTKFDLSLYINNLISHIKFIMEN